MRSWSKDASYRLIELDDLTKDPPAPEIAGDLEALRTISDWSRNYLTQPHPELGREGPVCPYAEGSRRKGAFFLAVRRGTDLDPEEIRRTVLAYRDWFLEIEPREGADTYFKTILILFPDLDQDEVERLIDGTQEALKPQFVAEGLMLGEFHAGPPDKAGLWNEDFRPLKSPVPMLVIRNMVSTDFGFLKHDRQMLGAYLELYGDHIPEQFRPEVERAVAQHGLSFPEHLALAALHPRVREALGEASTRVKVVRHKDLKQPVRGPGDVAEALGLSLDQITKSLFLRCHCHGNYAVVVCPVGRRVNLAAVAERMGCDRLEMASNEELTAVLGYAPGGVSPIAAGDMPVFMDQTLVTEPSVLVAAGRVQVEIEIDPTLLRDLTGAEVFPLSQPGNGDRATRPTDR